MSAKTMPVIVTGDDVTLAATLKKNGQTFSIDTAAEVKAMIVSGDHRQALTAAVDQDHTTTGADWANSLIMVSLPSSETGKITIDGRAVLEIQVNDGGKKTWFGLVTIERGQIP